MPPFLLLILASVFGASAFFLAGYLLRPPRAVPAATRENLGSPAPQIIALSEELDTVHAQQAIAEQAVASLKLRCQTEEELRRREETQRKAIEREQEELQHELKRREGEMKTLSDRLRTAENEHHTLFESQEKTASLWQDQWDAAKAERHKLEQTAKFELTSLRAQVTTEKEAHAKLQTLFNQLTEREAASRKALDESRADAPTPGPEKVQEQVQAIAAERERLNTAVQASEERAREAHAKIASLEGTLTEKIATLATLEAALDSQQAELAKAQQALAQVERADRAGASADLRQAKEEILVLKEAQQHLTLTLRSTTEELEQTRGKVATAMDAQHVAERRLAELDRLAKENSELREANAQAAAEVEWHAEQKDEAKDAKVELAKAQAKLVDLERLLEENRKLRDDVTELKSLKEAADELAQLQATHKQLRLDAELMSRRLQELQLDQADLPAWRTQAAEAANLNEEVNYLRQREKDLEAQIYASGFYASREMPAVSGETLVQTPMSDMETNLHTLVGDGGPRTAILADAQGFLIAGAGEHTTQEGLAAFAAVAGDMVSRARMLVPLADVEEVRVLDTNHTVLCCHLFKADEQGLGVLTLGPGEADPEATTRAIADLSIFVSGKNTDLAPPSEDTPEPQATT